LLFLPTRAVLCFTIHTTPHSDPGSLNPWTKRTLRNRPHPLYSLSTYALAIFFYGRRKRRAQSTYRTALYVLDYMTALSASPYHTSHNTHTAHLAHLDLALSRVLQTGDTIGDGEPAKVPAVPHAHLGNPSTCPFWSIQSTTTHHHTDLHAPPHQKVPLYSRTTTPATS
jgi:hypothetical protein